VDFQQARAKRREAKRRSLGSQVNGKTSEKELPPSTPKATLAKATKRPRRESVSNGVVTGSEVKRRMTSEDFKVNGMQASKGGGQKARASAKFMSEISSDMDDMEDIPATLPTSSQVAR
jgi:hypothetical protein